MSFTFLLFLAFVSVLIVTLGFLIARSRYGHVVSFILAGLAGAGALYAFAVAQQMSSGAYAFPLFGSLVLGAIGLIFLFLGLLHLQKRR